MSKRTSEDLLNAIENPDPNNLDVVDDEEEVFEGSELVSAADTLEQVDLLHTHAQELGENVFADCTSLTEMRVPDSLQEFGEHVFWKCSKLVPSDIDADGDSEASDDEGVTSEVVAYLRSKQ
ncbi:hypothetical protein TrST_g7005 [Triparma strigata]|uniref:Uncharacterized protein n=1 Tax=Triparma strigata TaxID=1606541 RepID=A0A9W7C7R3_9STRA|nr:hypothetical protein TrST_g7005 [Triparma strigata]